jgi:hypothetical protein
MEFFQKLAALDLKGTLFLQIAPSAGLVVAVRLDNENVTDAAKKIISPVILRGSAASFDETFFARIEEPIQQVSTLLTSMETFQKSVEDAKAQSAVEKAKTDETKKKAEDAKKGYDAAMKKVGDLEAENKHREAYGKLPKTEQFPLYTKAIKDKQTELRLKFSQGNLFDTLDDGQTEYAAEVSADPCTGPETDSEDDFEEPVEQEEED